MVGFTGTCPRCSGQFIWDELSQQLYCLEAKNVGVFGECKRGVNCEQHTFDQECATCAEELNEDEGIDVFDPPVVDQAVQGYQTNPGYRPQQAHQPDEGHHSKYKSKGKGRASDSHDPDEGRRKKKQRT